jgi:hypothetical protein
MFYNTMGSQKVPKMAALHCNGRTYGSAYLITFKVGSLRTHALAPSILPLLEPPLEGFFWNLPEFGRHIRFDSLRGCETCSLEAHLQSREQPKVTRSEIRRVRWLGDDTTSDVWLGALSWCRNHCPCLPATCRTASSNCIAQPVQNLQVEMTSNTLSRRYELMVHQSINVKEFREIFDCPLYSTINLDCPCHSTVTVRRSHCLQYKYCYCQAKIQLSGPK